MSWYTVALFAHIVGVLTLFITMALQWLITLRLRGARSIAQVREWIGLTKGVNRLVPVSGVLILGAGIYMTASAWSLLTTWVDVSLGAMGIMMIFSMGVVGRRLKAIERATAEAIQAREGSQDTPASITDTLPAALQARLDDRALWVSMQMTVAVALGIVFLMTTKPSLTLSLVVVVVSFALGAAVGATTARRQQAPQASVIGVEQAGAS